MRLEKREGINDCIIISDLRKSDFHALEEALDFLEVLSQGKEKVAILSDFADTPQNADLFYIQLAEELNQRQIKTLYGIGEEISRRGDLFSNFDAHFYQDTETFLEDFDSNRFREWGILVKGSNDFGFERIVTRLEANSHEAVLEIDLNKLKYNLKFVVSQLKTRTRIMAMVKAFAYGNGMEEIAAVLERLGVDYLAVAYADEGVALRQSGIDTPILVLNPIPSSYNLMLRYELEPQISSFGMLEKFASAQHAHSKLAPYPIHIKINSGMNRLGFDLNEMDQLAHKLMRQKETLAVHSVFSHLAGSDEEKFDSLTESQIKQFNAACEKLEQSGLDGFKRHILNSNGILRHPEAQMDMVRLGLGLYGLSTNAKIRQKLKPIGRLKTVISQIRTVSEGEGVGYSPAVTLTKKTRLGIIAMGYADGLPRLLGNGLGHVFVNGKSAPFIGNICMDMSMIDLSDIECVEGDEVEIFGENISIYSLAENLKTIPYEVLTNLSARVKRIFFQE